MYNRSSTMWNLIFNVMRNLPKSQKGRDVKVGLFWSAHQRFYRQMLMAAKVREGRVGLGSVGLGSGRTGGGAGDTLIRTGCGRQRLCWSPLMLALFFSYTLHQGLAA